MHVRDPLYLHMSVSDFSIWTSMYAEIKMHQSGTIFPAYISRHTIPLHSFAYVRPKWIFFKILADEYCATIAHLRHWKNIFSRNPFPSIFSRNCFSPYVPANPFPPYLPATRFPPTCSRQPVVHAISSRQPFPSIPQSFFPAIFSSLPIKPPSDEGG